jgi:CheY-like chemotaxis protein
LFDLNVEVILIGMDIAPRKTRMAFWRNVTFKLHSSMSNAIGAKRMSKRVLIADDKDPVRKSLSKDLENLGYDVREAADGEQALQELANDHIDLLICDVLMPNKTGWELLRAVKSNPKTKDVPVIVLTVKNVEPDMFSGYELGADYYMSKPFTKSQLLHGVQLLFEENYDSLSTAAASN